MTKHRLEMPLNRDIQQRKEVGAWAFSRKRVIKDYHNGDIKILQTEVGKGSTFRIILSRSKDA